MVEIDNSTFPALASGTKRHGKLRKREMNNVKEDLQQTGSGIQQAAEFVKISCKDLETVEPTTTGQSLGTVARNQCKRHRSQNTNQPIVLAYCFMSADYMNVSSKGLSNT